MHPKFKLASVGSFLCLMLLAPVLISSTRNTREDFLPKVSINYSPINYSGFVNSISSPIISVIEKAQMLYDTLGLDDFGINITAFEYAWKGYQYMLDKGLLKNPGILSICDFSQSSKRKRLYIIDLEMMKVAFNTYVAHGKKSGGEYASSFSNKMESHKSSLGFYVTGNTYQGDQGLSLRLEGLERGINDKADQRGIVIHGANYIGEDILRCSQFNGRSYGCPAVPLTQTPEIINTIKNGSCLFIYHPSSSYLNKSRILNG